jgi:hypothetical protein
MPDGVSAAGLSHTGVGFDTGPVRVYRSFRDRDWQQPKLIGFRPDWDMSWFLRPRNISAPACVTPDQCSLRFETGNDMCQARWSGEASDQTRRPGKGHVVRDRDGRRGSDSIRAQPAPSRQTATPQSDCRASQPSSCRLGPRPLVENRSHRHQRLALPTSRRRRSPIFASTARHPLARQTGLARERGKLGMRPTWCQGTNVPANGPTTSKVFIASVCIVSTDWSVLRFSWTRLRSSQWPGSPGCGSGTTRCLLLECRWLSASQRGTTCLRGHLPLPVPLTCTWPSKSKFQSRRWMSD